MKKAITITPYNPEWPSIFEKESAAIQKALGDNCIAIHHVGSTAVPGLIAKPKIDIIAVVKDAEAVATQVAPLGIQYRGEYNIPLHYGFSKRGEVDINLHVYEEGHPEIELNLLFRDVLRADSLARDEYALLKQELVSDEASFERGPTGFAQYTLRKGDFIRKVLKRAEFDRLRILKCNDETEWTAAQYFRNTYFFGPNGIEDPYTWTFNHEEHAHLVLYLGADIIGYAHIQLWPDKRAALRIIVVDEGKQNIGYGSNFLGFLEKWLKRRGIKSVHVDSRPTSIGFYRKNDYVDMPFEDPEEHESHPQDIAVGKIL